MKPKSRTKLAILFSSVAPMILLAGAARAEAATDANSVNQVSDVVVTVFKRSESLLKVPAVVNVVSGNDLRSAGVSNVVDLQNVVPGVSIGTGGFGVNVAIRGVTSTDETSKGELGIAFNIDGAYIGRGQEEGVAFFDLDRVEVLKGPQGTLYGRSSTGGAINVISKRPELDTFDGYEKLEFGNYNTRRGEGAINIPLGDTLAVRVAGDFNRRDGYLKPTDASFAYKGTQYSLPGSGQPAKNDQDDTTGRVSVLYKPNADLTATVIVTDGTLGGVGQSAAVSDNLDAGGNKQFTIWGNPRPAWVDDNFINVNEQLNWKFGAAQLDLLGNEQRFRANTQNTNNNLPTDGANGNPLTVGNDHYEGHFKTTQFEARVSNIETGFLDYVVGANYYQEHIHESDHGFNAPLNPDGSIGGVSTWTTGIDALNTTQHTSYGVFGQATAHLNSALSLIAGVRYTRDHTNRVGTFAVGPPAGACTGDYPGDCVGGPNNGNEVDSKVTWKVGLNYQMDPANLFYASVATGFKPGGFNDFDPKTNSTAPYRPEDLTAYEVGYKGRPLDKLTFTSSLYYYDYSADQINGLVLFPLPGGGCCDGVLYTQVVPAKIYGWESEARYALTHDTTLTAALALEHSSFTTLNIIAPAFLGGAPNANFHNYSIPNTPNTVLNLGANHNIALAKEAQLRLHAGTKISSGYDLDDFANGVRFRAPSFTRSSATITYATPGDRLTVQLFIENIENKVQRTSGPNNYNGAFGGLTGNVPSPEASYGAGGLSYGVSTPRFFGIRLGSKF